MKNGTYYMTSYCNFAHRLRDGAPISHECRIIPPAALHAEMAGKIPEAIEIMESEPPKKRRFMIRGVKE